MYWEIENLIRDNFVDFFFNFRSREVLYKTNYALMKSRDLKLNISNLGPIFYVRFFGIVFISVR